MQATLLKVVFVVVLSMQLPGLLAAETKKTVPANKLGRSEYCGLCHTAIYQQWNASSHHFSSFNNPIYRKVVLTEVGLEKTETLEFCAGCHDPIPRAANELEQLDPTSWSANSGITCLACHRISDEAGMENGDYTIVEPFLHPFALAQHPSLQKAHELMLNLTPWLHRKVLSKPFYKTPEFCASCHTLKVPASINGHNELTVLNEYGHWKQSHYGPNNENGDSKRICQDCHMPLVKAEDPAAKNGMVHDHSFAAGNTALPVFNRDFKHLEKAERFLSNNIVSLELRGIRTEPDAAFTTVEQLKLDGEESAIELQIAVHNNAVGHHFPAGTVDSNEVWLSLSCTDKNDAVISRQGFPDESGSLPQGVTRFGAYFTDANGKRTDRRTTTTRAIALAHSNLIPAGEHRTVQVSIPLPKNTLHLPLSCQTQLNWRKYDPKFIDWVFDGRPTPPLPITTLAKLEFALPADSVALSLNQIQH